MKSSLEQIPITLPSTNRLLSPNEGHREHPPIYLKLSQNALEVLAQNGSPPEMQLSLSDSDSSLRINDLEFRGSLSKESGHVEVYLPEQNGYVGSETTGKFRSYGQINSRITIKAGEPERISSRTSIDLSETNVSKIENLLSVKPARLKELSSKTNVSEAEVRKILQDIAEPHPGELFILRKRTKAPSKIPEIKKETKANTKTRVEVQPIYRTSKNAETKQDQASGTASPRTEDPTLKMVRGATESTSLQATKRRAANSANESKRLKSEKSSDMFELARKFQSAYDEYLELYSLLSKRETRPVSQVQKLVAMHNQLAQWKKTLWSNARSKSQVK